MNQQHEMILEKTHLSGEEDWCCPTCGRRMMIMWHPWKKVILEPGDVYAGHSASKGGLRFAPLQITQGYENDPTSATELSAEDPYLAPWQRWLDEVGFEDLWNDDA